MASACDDEDEELPDVMQKRAGIGLIKKKNALPEFKEYFSCPPLHTSTQDEDDQKLESSTSEKYLPHMRHKGPEQSDIRTFLPSSSAKEKSSYQ